MFRGPAFCTSCAGLSQRKESLSSGLLPWIPCTMVIRFYTQKSELMFSHGGRTHGVRQKLGRSGHEVHSGVTGPPLSPALRVSRECSPLLKAPQRSAGLIEHRAVLASYAVRRAVCLDLGLNSWLCYLLTYEAGRVGGHLCFPVTG